MNEKSRKILGGMSTAGLILAGSLPLMAKAGQVYCGGHQCGKAKANKSNAKDNKTAAKKNDKAAAAKDAKDNAKKTPPPAAKTKAKADKTK